MQFLFKLLLISSLLFVAPYSVNLSAQSDNQASQKNKYRKARVLQASTAKKITKVVEALERQDEEGKDDPDWITVKEILNELLTNKKEMNRKDIDFMLRFFPR